MEEAGVADRCTLMLGYVQDVPVEEQFDAVLSILVGHFVKREDRADLYKHIHQRLKTEGYFINTEISFDMESQSFPSMLENWKKVQILMGAHPDSLKALPEIMKTVLTVLPPSEVEELFRESGFVKPIRFFQAFMISGWYTKKG